MRQFVIVAAAGAVTVALTMARNLTAIAGASPPDELQAARVATARYHSLEQARRDGYTWEGEPCVSAPPPPGLSGAMGIHAVNPALIGDGVIDPLRPEILLYVPGADGELELVGVEYFEVAAVTGGVAPSVFGRELDGPMPGHNPTMPEHYDLHVWLWADNPAGMFAPFNPALSCPA
jgi:hypothetical protein